MPTRRHLLADQDRWHGFTRENFGVAKDHLTPGVLERDVVAIFCCDCSAAEQARKARDFHQREPLRPAGAPVRRVVQLASGHSPFLSLPQALAQALLEAARD